MAKTLEQIVEALNAPLDTSRVKYRKAPGMGEVPYLEGYDQIENANRIFEYQWSFDIVNAPKIEGWDQVKTVWNAQERRKMPMLDKDGNPVTDRVGIVYVTGRVEVNIGGVIYGHSDLGRSVFTGDTPEVLDTALAGAVTDCMKRCFRQLGNQFGNTLYDKEYRDENLGGSGDQHSSENGARKSAPAQQPKANGASKPAQAAKPSEAAKPAANDLEAAKAAVVPAGLPLAGRTLGEALALAEKGDIFGRAVIRWLSGTDANKAGVVFKPEEADAAGRELQAKALVVAKQLPVLQ